MSSDVQHGDRKYDRTTFSHQRRVKRGDGDIAKPVTRRFDVFVPVRVVGRRWCATLAIRASRHMVQQNSHRLDSLCLDLYILLHRDLYQTSGERPKSQL